MLFQNIKDTELCNKFQNIKDIELCNKQLQTRSKKDVLNELKVKRALEHTHKSQKLVPSTKHFARGKNTDLFKINLDPDSN